MNTLYLLVGLPGSGKSTYATTLSSKLKNSTLRSNDNLRTELLGDIENQEHNAEIGDLCQSLVIADLYAGKDVIFDATNLYRKHRKEFLQKLSLIQCKKICIYLKAPVETCWTRTIKRGREVPYDTILRMHDRMRVPSEDEGWDSIEVIENF